MTGYVLDHQKVLPRNVPLSGQDDNERWGFQKEREDTNPIDKSLRGPAETCGMESYVLIL